MKTIDLPYFGLVQIDPSEEEQRYEAFADIGELEVELNLIFLTEEVQLKDFIAIKNFLIDLEKFAVSCKQAIVADYLSGGQTKRWIDSHVDAFEDDGKELLMETLAQDFDSLEDYFLHEAELDHIYMFADDENEFIKLNYMVSGEITDEVICVRLDKNLKIAEVHTEY